MQQPIGNSTATDKKLVIVMPPVDKERSDCWEADFASQFPVNTQGQPDGMAKLSVNSPHEGYRIEAQIVNGTMQGKASVYSNADILVAEVCFEAGVANGPCKLFDPTGKLFFEGKLKSGYRSGKGKEYDREGRVLFDGYFKMGKRMSLVPSNEMRGYWKEYSEDGTLLSVSERNKDTGEKEGLCLCYKEGSLYCVAQIKDGQETHYEGFLKYFEEQKRIWFEGSIIDGRPNGYGEEYDTEGNYVFKGLYDYGRRLTVKKMFGKGGYHKEFDSEEKLVNICKRDENNKLEGICYHFDDGKISDIIEFTEGRMTRVLATFEKDKMTQFENKLRVYEGNYYKKSDFEYIPDGFGQEFDADGETLIYQGYYLKGKKHGYGELYQDGELVYDGLWILGNTKTGYYIRYSIIAIVTIVVLVALPFIFFGLRLEVAFMIDFYATIFFFLYLLKVYCCPVKNEIDLFFAGLLHKKTLKIKDFGFNDSYTFIAPRFTKYIDIRDVCFKKCSTFELVGLHRLKSLKVGITCFYDFEHERPKNSGSFDFIISNCVDLESIDIGSTSFVEYDGKIELKTLPSLRVLKIGDINSKSGNFIDGSFMIHGWVICN